MNTQTAHRPSIEELSPVDRAFVSLAGAILEQPEEVILAEVLTQWSRQEKDQAPVELRMPTATAA